MIQLLVNIELREWTRFWAKVDFGDCWMWTASTQNAGYSQFAVRRGDRRTVVLGHRWTYEVLVGPIPSGHDLDHLCRVKRCVNPDHLEPVTRKVNISRGSKVKGSRVAQCRLAGHDLGWQRRENGKRYRYCKTCTLLHRKAMREGRRSDPKFSCSEPGCQRPWLAKGLCDTHYNAARRTTFKITDTVEV